MRGIFIDPSYKAFYEGRFLEESEVNRDDMLRPYIRMKEELTHRGVFVDTADRIPLRGAGGEKIEYYSFGIMDNIESLRKRDDVIMKVFCIFEPPAVMPDLYAALPKLTKVFERVFIHNVHGDGYSLRNVDASRLQKLFWPQPYNHVLECSWASAERSRKVAVINGNHKSTNCKELYSSRIEAMAALAKHDLVDLYGSGWERWWSRSSMWWPYWKNRHAISKIYRGFCKSKFEVFSRYEFCLCFENMVMEGYVTEKLFDCLYAGCVPLYLGAPNIGEYVPENVYFDVSKAGSWQEVVDFVNNVSPERIQQMRVAGRKFIESERMNPYYDSLKYMIE